MSTSKNDPLIGLVVDGKYTIIEPIGRGGMGSVYKARQDSIKRDVAIKFLSLNILEESREQFVARFEREAETASQIRHPSAITIFDYGVGTVGERPNTPYLVMEFIAGESLKQIIEKDGRIAAQRLIPLIVQVCGALEEAHSLGIIHRDLKPDNIMVSKRSDGTEWAHVLDFGIAKRTVEDASDPSLTKTGSIMGTPRYMAPEQIWTKEVDARTDIYALGLVLYEALSGRLPFEGSSMMDLAIKITSNEVEPLSKRAPEIGLAKSLERVVMRALRKDPQQRQHSAQELGQELMEASPSGFIFLSGSLAFSGFRRGARVKAPKVALLASLSLLLVVLGVGAVYLPSVGNRSTARKAIQEQNISEGKPVENDQSTTPRKQSKELLTGATVTTVSESPSEQETSSILNEKKDSEGRDDKGLSDAVAPEQANPAQAVAKEEKLSPKDTATAAKESTRATEAEIKAERKSAAQLPIASSVDTSTLLERQKEQTSDLKKAVEVNERAVSRSGSGDRLLQKKQEQLKAAERRLQELELEAKRRQDALKRQAEALERKEREAAERKEALAARRRKAVAQQPQEPKAREKTEEPTPDKTESSPPRRLLRRCGPSWCPQ